MCVFRAICTKCNGRFLVDPSDPPQAHACPHCEKAVQDKIWEGLIRMGVVAPASRPLPSAAEFLKAELSHMDEQPQGSGRKDDADKPQMDLVPPLMEREVARVLTFGAKKYGPDNWRHVPGAHQRYHAAARRHINSLSRGETHDPETGLHHAAHAVCCLMFWGEKDMEGDDNAT